MNKLVIEGAAAAAVSEIVGDLSGRRGLRQEWEQIDDEIQEEIQDAWRAAVVRAIRSVLSKGEAGR